MQTYQIIIEQGEDGYLISSVIGLAGCRTQAKNYEQLIERTKEAILLYKMAKKKETPTKFLALQNIEVAT